MANREDPERQLNIHGLTPEFLEAMNEGVMAKELLLLHEKLLPFGFKNRASQFVARSGRTSLMRMTYDSPKTKLTVVSAAKSAKVWDLQVRDARNRIVFFREKSS